MKVTLFQKEEQIHQSVSARKKATPISLLSNIHRERENLRPVITVVRRRAVVHHDKEQFMNRVAKKLGLSYLDKETGKRVKGSCPYTNEVNDSHCRVCNTHIRSVDSMDQLATKFNDGAHCVSFSSDILDW